MTAWELIDSDALRAWEWHDSLGRWFGRELAACADDALLAAATHLAGDPAYTGSTITVSVRCLATDERARITTTITEVPSCLPLY